MNTEEFITKARKIHGNKYDYSKVVYINCHIPVTIICPEHGEFEQKPYLHLSNRGCKECGKDKTKEKLTLTINDIQIKSNKIYGDNVYKIKNRDEKTVKFICNNHGEKEKSLYRFLQGCGCEECGKINRIVKTRDTVKEFVEKAKKIHGDKYDYSNVNYEGSKVKISIICPEHGEFWMKPNCHLNGQGCPKCGNKNKGSNKKLTTEEFIEKAKEVHGDRYDYSKVKYVNNHTKVCIICPEHGEFWQTPSKHIDSKHDCPLCNEFKLEKEIRQFLIENNINFEFQKRFDWLEKQSLDFYLPDYNIAIECQGIQHFEPKDFFGGEKAFQEQLERDIRKYNKSMVNSIKVLYYVPYFNDLNKNYLSDIYTNNNILFKKSNLLFYINKKGKI